MGKTRGNRQGRLADMTITPPHYKPPPVPPAVETTFPVELTETDEFRIRQVMWSRRIVDFAIVQLYREEDALNQVAKIDCCHSKIHRHQYTRDGGDLYDHLEIKAIPADGGDRWSIVHAGYYDALGLMQEEWEDNRRRWQDGR